jgi:hypothetical protein
MNIYDAKEINGTYALQSTTPAPFLQNPFSAFRVKFAAAANNLTNISSVKCCIVTADGTKIFAATYTTSNGFENTFIQIPLVGQTILSFVNALNKNAAIVASVVNNYYDASVKILNETAFSDILEKDAHFSVNTDNVYASTLEIKNSIGIFYTSMEPFAVQNNFHQSFGGYIAANKTFNGFKLKESLGVYASRIIFDPTTDQNVVSVNDLIQSEYIQINDEIIKISQWQNNIGFISQRNVFDTPLRMHPIGSRISIVDKNAYFDQNIGTSRKQYRCYAIKNLHKTYTIKDLRLFSSINNRNDNSQIRIAFEATKSDYFEGVASSEGITAFSVFSLINKKPIDYYKNAPIKFISGANINQSRLIKSYTPSTGTLELNERLAFNISNNDNFIIDPQPSTKMKSSNLKPNGPLISEFVDIPNDDMSVPISNLLPTYTASNLLPNQMFYLWIERSIGPQSDEYINNRISLSFSFNTI